MAGVKTPPSLIYTSLDKIWTGFRHEFALSTNRWSRRPQAKSVEFMINSEAFNTFSHFLPLRISNTNIWCDSLTVKFSILRHKNTRLESGTIAMDEYVCHNGIVIYADWRFARIVNTSSNYNMLVILHKRLGKMINAYICLLIYFLGRGNMKSTDDGSGRP